MLMRSSLLLVNNFLNCNKKISLQLSQTLNKKNKIHFWAISLKKNPNKILCQKLPWLSIVKKSFVLIPNILWFLMRYFIQHLLPIVKLSIWERTRKFLLKQLTFIWEKDFMKRLIQTSRRLQDWLKSKKQDFQTPKRGHH